MGCRPSRCIRRERFAELLQPGELREAHGEAVLLPGRVEQEREAVVEDVEPVAEGGAFEWGDAAGEAQAAQEVRVLDGEYAVRAGESEKRDGDGGHVEVAGIGAGVAVPGTGLPNAVDGTGREGERRVSAHLNRTGEPIDRIERAGKSILVDGIQQLQRLEEIELVALREQFFSECGSVHGGLILSPFSLCGVLSEFEKYQRAREGSRAIE